MIKKIKIANKSIGENLPCFIIAEAGVNHNGKLRLAKKMVDLAKKANADAIKFQLFKTEELVVKDAPKADYQAKTVPGKTQYEMLKNLELSESDFRVLSDYCRRKKILFLSSCFDAQSADFLRSLRLPAYKIGSGELTNYPLIKKIAKFKKPIILSTGMANLSEIRQAVSVIYSTGNRDLILLHCTSNYPTQFQDVNLKAMETLHHEFKVPVGYSDHTEGSTIALVAVAMGACVIEKHFTLDRHLSGPDHQASLEGQELKQMIDFIRIVESVLGNGIKSPQKSEMEMRKIARRSLVAAADIPKGTILSSKLLAIKRPGTGIGSENLEKVINKRVNKDIKKDRLLSWDDLK